MNIVNQDAVTTLALRTEPMSAEDVLRLALEKFGRRAALSSSFGAEDMVLIDMLMNVTRAPASSRWTRVGCRRKPTTSWTPRAALRRGSRYSFRKPRRFSQWSPNTA